MATTWFVLLGFMLTMYVVLDGFDLGAGIVHFAVARREDERRTVFASIGPVWDGNEVWLIAAGGLLVFAFPRAYAVALSGFYLPLMLVLWLFVLRGISIELRSHQASPMWRAAFDVIFTGSSTALAFVLGVALGNVLRGVPIDSSGYFAAPFFTNLGHGGELGALDWYTISIGLFAVAALAAHGAMYLTWKTRDELNRRARRVAWRAWIAVVVLFIIITIETAFVRPGLLANLAARPVLWLAPAAAIAGLAVVFLSLRRSTPRDESAIAEPANAAAQPAEQRPPDSPPAPAAALATAHAWERRGFLASAIIIASLLVLTAGALYPTVLPSTVGASYSLDIHNAANDRRGLIIGLVWWIPAIVLAISYSAYLFRSFRGKVSATDHY